MNLWFGLVWYGMAWYCKFIFLTENYYSGRPAGRPGGRAACRKLKLRLNSAQLGIKAGTGAELGNMIMVKKIKVLNTYFEF